MKRGTRKDNQALTQIQNYKVIKSNDIIQKSRFRLSLQEQKIILYLISKIKPEDIEFKEHIFEIRDFCRVCGIEPNSGSTYEYIKNTLKDLRDKSIWVELESGIETTLAWIDKVSMIKDSGKVIIKIDNDMKPYLLQMQKCFTSYELLYILAMKSQYSIRLYELLKSYEFKHKIISDIDDLKKMLFAEKYNRFPDFQRKVLDISMREINDLSDLIVTYEPIKDGRRYAKIEFSVKMKKGVDERLKTFAKIDKVINPAQLSLFDLI